MPSPNAVFTELVSTTFRKHRPGVNDNLSNRNALVGRIFKKGNYERVDGGLTIVETLDYNENSTYQRFSDWDILNIQASNVISSAEYQWRNIALSIASSGTELRTNSGNSRIKSLAKAKLKNAMRTFYNNFSNDMYSDGTLANQINGLQAIIKDTGTGTVGGIDSSAFPFWQNQIFDITAEGVTLSATTIENSVYLPLWLGLDRGGGDSPDIIVSDNNHFQFYETSQVSQKRYTSSDSATGGFASLKYKSADVMFDGNSGIPANHSYFCNTEYLRLVVHEDADLEIMTEQRPINQDGEVVPILWMGNMVCGNRNQQGVAF